MLRAAIVIALCGGVSLALGVKVDGRLEPNLPAWVGEYRKAGK